MTVPLEDRMRSQADYCRASGSPLTANLLEGAADELRSGGAVQQLLVPLEDDPPDSHPDLRFAGALHRLVLEGRAPALAAHYPSVGGVPGDVWPAARRTVEEHLAALHPLVRRPVQTNEVGRSSALLGGLLHVVARTGLPVRLLEVGASGGLNLHVDRYRHEVARATVLGDPASPVVLDAPWQGTAPPYDAPLQIVERLGGDPDPLDPGRTQDRRTLLSYVWADQRARLERLRSALQVAAATGVRVRRATASELLAQELHPRSGTATVVWHSVVWQYLAPDERERVRLLLEAAGRQAGPDAPVAHLALEPDDDVGDGGFTLALTLWPDGERQVLADCHGHGPPVVWR